MSYVPDNYDLFEKKEAEDAEWLAKRPVCDCCGEPIQGSWQYAIDGDIYCFDCMKDNFGERIDD